MINHKMGLQVAPNNRTSPTLILSYPSFSTSTSLPFLGSPCFQRRNVLNLGRAYAGLTSRESERIRRRKKWSGYGVVLASANSNVAGPLRDSWKPDNAPSSPSLSDILWPSVGAFAAMALMGKVDQMLAPKGISMTIAPFGAVCAVLFAAPSSPAARKYNMFIAQIGCAAIGVTAFSLFGPGWLARSAALATSIAFMIFTRSTHPPAASLPLLFIDGVKFHHLNFWYALFPGATGCIILCLIQEVVTYLKDNIKF